MTSSLVAAEERGGAAGRRGSAGSVHSGHQGLTVRPRPACKPASPWRRAPGSPRTQNPRAPSPTSGAGAGGRSTQVQSSAPAGRASRVRGRGPGTRRPPPMHMHVSMHTGTHTPSPPGHVRLGAARRGGASGLRHPTGCEPPAPRRGERLKVHPPPLEPVQVSDPGAPRGPTCIPPRESWGSTRGLLSPSPAWVPLSHGPAGAGHAASHTLSCAPAPLASDPTRPHPTALFPGPVLPISPNVCHAHTPPASCSLCTHTGPAHLLREALPASAPARIQADCQDDLLSPQGRPRTGAL